jgi:ABC-type phosphate/phosphonate transport system substrate-binding protein
MLRRGALSFLVLAGAASLAFATDEMIFVYPGKPPATQEAAGKVLKPFTDYVEQKAGWGAGALHATYYYEEPAANQAASSAKWGIVSLSVYLKWKKAGTQMTIVAQSELDKKPTMQFHLLVPADSKITSLATIKGAHVASSYLEDRDFAKKIVFDGEVDCTDPTSGIAVIDTKMMGTALSYCSKFRLTKDGTRIDALLVDDEQLGGLEGKKADFAKMKVIWHSKALPTPPVVRFGAANQAQDQKMLTVLKEMPNNGAGRKILEDMTTTGFREPNMAAYAAAEKAY